MISYQREWKAIRDDLFSAAAWEKIERETKADSPERETAIADQYRLAGLLGLELLAEMLADPDYRYMRERQQYADQVKAERDEAARLEAMTSVERLGHAARSGETSVFLTPRQAQQLSGRRWVEICVSKASILARDPMPPPLRSSWDLCPTDDGGALATLR
jgi:hypothetical protein